MRTLVLNATYQPLAVVTVKRAVVLVLTDVADCVVSSGETFRASTLSVEAPAVIRLRRNIKIPWRSSVPLTRHGVLTRDGKKCAYCHKPAGTIDHVLPRSRGGRHEWMNVVAACGKCNHTKADRTPHEAKMVLRFEPHEPKGLAAFAVGLREVDPLWRPWLGLEPPEAA
jgi:5-methylcytosine-specific restriction endonuclease McrA